MQLKKCELDLCILKQSGTRTGLKTLKKNLERKTLKDLQKAWRTIADNHRKITRRSGIFEAK